MENRVAGAQARQASPRSSTAVRFLPGPWKLGEVRLPGGVRWDAIVRGPNGEPICSALMAGYSNKQGQANAHLIAAAPEMYKALKAARLYVECCTEPNTPAEKALALLDAALRKAEGGV